uniref:Uncharacterized protein n=1 Tax=Arundo donax TaxID=35708 RepID=A0A0A9CU45_ARUDO
MIAFVYCSEIIYGYLKLLLQITKYSVHQFPFSILKMALL